MAWKVTVAGVDKTSQVLNDAGITITPKLNERGIAALTFKPGYLPGRLEELVLYDIDGVTALYTGVILKRSIEPVDDQATAFVTHVECGDYFTHLDWAFVTLTYAADVTLKTVLTDLVAALPGTYGITVDAGQVDGPTLAAFSWTRKRASDAVRELSQRSQYVASMSALKAIKMFVPGTDAAPKAFTDAATGFLAAQWSDTDPVPVTKVTVICGPDGAASTTQTWTQAGGATSWVTDIPAALDAAPPGTVLVGGVTKTVGPGAMYEWDATTHTLSLGTDSLPADGTVIVLVFVGQFPFQAVADSGGSPIVEFQQEYPEVVEYGPALELAASLLDSLDDSLRELDVVSKDSGWAVGQGFTVNIAKRAAVATFLITTLSITLTPERYWRYEFSATEDAIYQGSSLDQWRVLTGSSSGITTAGGSGSTVVVTPLSSPFGLGGSRDRSQPVGTSKTAVLDWQPFVPTANGTVIARVTTRARTAGVDVTPEIAVWDSGLGDWVTHTTGSATGGTNETQQEFSVLVTAGDIYILRYYTDTAGASAYCIGQVATV